MQSPKLPQLCPVTAKRILTALCLGLCLTLLSCNQRIYVPVVEVIAPPEALYAPKAPPAPPVEPGRVMTARQMAEWLSRYIDWVGEACADREAMRLWVDKMQREDIVMGKEN